MMNDQKDFEYEVIQERNELRGQLDTTRLSLQAVHTVANTRLYEMASTSRGYSVEELRALVEYMMGEIHRLSGGDSGPSH